MIYRGVSCSVYAPCMSVQRFVCALGARTCERYRLALLYVHSIQKIVEVLVSTRQSVRAPVVPEIVL